MLVGTSGLDAGERDDEQVETLDCQSRGRTYKSEVHDENHHKDHDVNHVAEGHENHHAKCEKKEFEDKFSPRDGDLTKDQEESDWQLQCGLCNEDVQRGCITLMKQNRDKRHQRQGEQFQFKQSKPRGKSDNGIDVLKGNELPGPTIVRNNHVGTTCEVYDHSSTTHVDCETSAKEMVELPMGTEGTEEDYPWYSAANIRKWIEIEWAQPKRSWTIDNHDGAESFKELKMEPMPRGNAGEDMPPETFQALRRQLQGVERELDEFVSRGDVTEESRERQWKHWTKIDTELCNEFSGGEEEMTESEDDESCPRLGTSQTQRKRAQTTWRHGGQPYYVARWSTMDVTKNPEIQVQNKSYTANRMINCFLRGTKPESDKRNLAILEDEESDEEEEQLVCSMAGQKWEPLPFPVIIDSGACASVMPSGWCKHVPAQKIKQSEAGEYSRAANGSIIYNEGQKSVSMMTRKGIWRDMRFTICDVSKALGSVIQMCRAGHIVVFKPPWHEDGSYIQHLDTGEKMWLEETNGLYVLNAKVAPKEWQTTLNQGFARQATLDC